MAQLEFRNLTDQSLFIGDFSQCRYESFGPQDAQLLTGYYDGEGTKFFAQSKFTGSSIPFFSSEPRTISQRIETWIGFLSRTNSLSLF